MKKEFIERVKNRLVHIMDESQMQELEMAIIICLDGLELQKECTELSTEVVNNWEYCKRYLQYLVVSGKSKGTIGNYPDGMEDDSVTSLASSQQWSASLRQCVSEISQRKWYPQRNKIISLGIHLNMNLEQINKMLDFAQMEAICAKNPFDNAIIYALENAQLEDIIRTDGTDVLCRYVKKILESLDYSGVDFFLEELPKDYDEDEIF